MDILTYHSRVKNKAAESLRSIKAKVGFVPRDVEEHLQELQRVEVGSRFIVPDDVHACAQLHIIRLSGDRLPGRTWCLARRRRALQ